MEALRTTPQPKPKPNTRPSTAKPKLRKAKASRILTLCSMHLKAVAVGRVVAAVVAANDVADSEEDSVYNDEIEWECDHEVSR
jgi:hypothetical protein